MLLMVDQVILQAAPDANNERFSVSVRDEWSSEVVFKIPYWPGLLLALVPLFGIVPANAASFDCARAASVVEKNICSSPALSRLDEKLNSVYGKVRKTSADIDALIKEQRDWVKATRNACNSEQCLARAYEARIFQLEHRISDSRNSCPVEEKALLGSWRQIGSADFEEFAFVQDSEGRSFISWLHGKPEFAGTWVFDKCLIKISNPDIPDLDFTFKVLGL